MKVGGRGEVWGMGGPPRGAVWCCPTLPACAASASANPVPQENASLLPPRRSSPSLRRLSRIRRHTRPNPETGTRTTAAAHRRCHRSSSSSPCLQWTGCRCGCVCGGGEEGYYCPLGNCSTLHSCRGGGVYRCPLGNVRPTPQLSCAAHYCGPQPLPNPTGDALSSKLQPTLRPPSRQSRPSLLSCR